MSKDKPTLAIIDGDIISYRSAFAIEKRYIEVVHKKSGKSKFFDTRTDFWGRGKNLGGWLGEQNEQRDLDGKTLFTKDDFEIIDHKEVEPVEHALHIAKTTIDNICKSCNVKDYIIVLETDETVNFRNDLATIRKYKDREQEKPQHLQEVKDYLIKYHKAIVPKNHETDDEIVIQAYKTGGIQCTLDKDAMQCNGTWIYVWDKSEKPFYIPEKGVGKVWKDEKNKVRAYGLKSLCLQMLTGDPVDTIDPKYLTEEKFGEKGAFDILEILKTPKQCLGVVVAKYKEWYPEPVTYRHWNELMHDSPTDGELTKDWLEIAEEMFSLLWMKRKEDDSMTFKKLLDVYGVDYE